MDIAKLYIITNYEKYVVNNGDDISGKVEDAAKWKSRESAENVKKTCRAMRLGLIDDSWEVVPFSEKGVLTAVDKDEELTTMIQTVKDFIEMVTYAKTKTSVLVQQLSIVDKKISDIEHFIELTNQSASNGYKLYRQLKELRMERRKIKNRLYIYQHIWQNNQIQYEYLEMIPKWFENIEFIPKILNIDDLL